jgi:hypothetical protein
VKSKTVDFWTSNEYSGFLASIVSELNQEGIVTRQRFHLSDQSYRKHRGKFGRLWLRVRQYILYPIQLCGALTFQPKPDIIVVTTTTFYAPLLASFMHRRPVYLLFDLFPEALIQSGGIKHGAAKEKWISKITDSSLKRCVARRGA